MNDKEIHADPVEVTEIASTSVDGVSILASEVGWAMGQIGPCILVAWRGPVTEHALDLINARLLVLTEQHPGKCAYINVIERNSPVPSAPLRKASMAGLIRLGDSLGCMIAVVEGHELRATVARAVLTGMALLRSQGQPTKFVKNTEEMSQWVNKLLAVSNEFDRELVLGAEVIRGQIR